MGVCLSTERLINSDKLYLLDKYAKEYAEFMKKSDGLNYIMIKNTSDLLLNLVSKEFYELLQPHIFGYTSLELITYDSATRFSQKYEAGDYYQHKQIYFNYTNFYAMSKFALVINNKISIIFENQSKYANHLYNRPVTWHDNNKDVDLILIISNIMRVFENNHSKDFRKYNLLEYNLTKKYKYFPLLIKLIKKYLPSEENKIREKNKYDNEINNLTLKLDKLTPEIEQIQSELTQLNSEISTIKSEIFQLENKLNNDFKQIKEIQLSIGITNTENLKSKINLKNEIESNIKNDTSELNIKRIKLNDIESLLKSKTTYLKNMRTQSDDYRKIINIQRNNIESLNLPQSNDSITQHFDILTHV